MIAFGEKPVRRALERYRTYSLGREPHGGTLPDVDDAEPVRVHLALGYLPGEPLADDDEAPMWLTFTSGPICLLREEVVFTDAAEGAGYWRAQGVERIFVSLESACLEGHFLWAGIGAPPLDPTTGKEMEVFSDDDPRGRREGALRTQLADMERENESRRAWHADMPGATEKP